jgi:hypothetical protein
MFSSLHGLYSLTGMEPWLCEDGKRLQVASANLVE